MFGFLRKLARSDNGQTPRMYPALILLLASSGEYMKRTLIHQLRTTLQLQNVAPNPHQPPP
ncbi:MAG: hypothetical protein CMM05_06840 [Rhodopirellula sp.]|nr:hypothetical protein [Rhodopirellula sp.]